MWINFLVTKNSVQEVIMSNSRKTIGIILPSSNTTLERDFQLVGPANVDISYHSGRMMLVTGELDKLNKMNDDIEMASRQVGTAKVGVIAYGCTGGSFLNGPGWDKELLRMITDASGGIPSVATSAAMVEVLKNHGIKKVSVATPYKDPVNAKLRAFLEGYDFDVLNVAGRQLTLNTDIGSEQPDDIVEFALNNFDDEADAMFLSCTNWRALEAVARVEKQLQKPVFTSNQVTIWAALKTIGVNEPVHGFGSLLEEIRVPVAA